MRGADVQVAAVPPVSRGPGSRRAALGGAVTGLVLGALVLGPGLGRGFLLSYDMVFVPREPFSAALPGLAPPRAVPSDLVIAAASRVLPGDMVQKLVLLGIFVLACAGVAELLDREPLPARLAGGVFYACNPYVGERLIIGHWALLLGYAGLPWVLRATLRPDLASRRGAARLGVAMLPAIVGGFAAMAITALVVAPAAAATKSPRRIAMAASLLAAGSLPWLIPSLQHPVYADPAGIAAFAARADTPFGSVGSLLMLGGMWNARAVPDGYGGPWSALWLVIALAALTAFTLAAVRSRPAGRRWPGLGIAAVLGLAIACVGVTAVGRDLLRSVQDAWPGIAVIRDAQQFIAPLALALACGAGLLVSWAVNPPSLSSKIFGIAGILAPALLLPGLFWGAAGKLRPAWYPGQWLAAARLIDASRAQGDVLLLPWATYRTPGWNHGHTLLDPWPRLVSRTVVWNDGTKVGDVALAPDEPRARALDALIQGGEPLTASLTKASIRFVVVDDGPDVTKRLPGATRIFDTAGLIVYLLPK